LRTLLQKDKHKEAGVGALGRGVDVVITLWNLAFTDILWRRKRKEPLFLFYPR
jgi:hypothetical protein